MFKMDEKYYKNIEPKDGLISIAVVLIVYINVWAFFRYVVPSRVSNIVAMLLGIGVILTVIIITILRKQTLDTIGLTKVKTPYILVVVFTILFLALSIIYNDFYLIKQWIFYLLGVGAMEEIVYRGYMFNRIYIMTKSKKWTVVICGVAFGWAHIFGEVYKGNSLLSSLFNNVGGAIFFSCFFMYIYSKTKNICYPIILHVLMDFSPDIISFVQRYIFHIK